MKPQKFKTPKGEVEFHNYPGKVHSNGIAMGIATADEACKALKIGPRELENLKRQGLPFIIVAGEHERFIVSDCVAWRKGTFGKRNLVWDTKHFVTIEGPALRTLNAVAARLAGN